MLVLVSGILTLLLFLMVLILQLSRAHSLAASSWASVASARAASESGMEYAAARLAQSSMPGEGSMSGRGDDWRSRDPLSPPPPSPEASLNPSFSHGDHWDDALSPDGRFAPWETPRTDRDGDGRFSAWTSRLRGGASPHSVRFSLRIGSTEGLIPLNAGQVGQALVDGVDNDWDGLADEPDEVDVDGYVTPRQLAWPMPSAANGVPDHRDVEIQYHRSLAAVLDNLGALLFDPSTGTRRWDIPGSVEPYKLSWLGHDLITRRPLGGYRSWEEVERALLNLPNAPPYEGAPYRKEELDAIRPFLDLGPYEGTGEASRCRFDQPLTPLRYAPISAWTAPREVLQSLWCYLLVGTFWDRDYGPTSPYPTYLVNDHLGEASGPSKGAPQGGLYGSVEMILFPDEAGALADRILSLRSDLPLSWTLIRETFLREADQLFAADAAALGSGVSTPVFRWSWLCSKAGLAYHAVAQDPYPFRGAYDCLGSWAYAWFDANPDVSGLQPPPAIGFEKIHRLMSPARFDRGGTPIWSVKAIPTPGSADIAYHADASPNISPEYPDKRSNHPLVKPQGLSIAPPVRFTVASAGVSGSGFVRSAEGTFRAWERLDFACQEDFECLDRGRALLKQGISVVDPSPWLRRGAPLKHSPKVTSLPRINWRGITTDASARRGICYGFSRGYGALTLGQLEAGLQGAKLYWPFTEDYDGMENLAAPPAWKECWPYHDPAYPWPAGLKPWQFVGYRGILGYAGDEKTGPDFEFWDPTRRVRKDFGGGFQPDTTYYGIISPFMMTKGPNWSIDAVSFSMHWPAVNPGGGLITRSFGLGAVLGPSSRVNTGFGTGGLLTLSTRRGFKPDVDNPGTFFKVRVRGISPVGGVKTTEKEWFIPDSFQPQRTRSYDVLLSMIWQAGDTFTAQLYVNGLDTAYEGGMSVAHPWQILRMQETHLSFVDADEVRLYGESAGAPSNLGRFVKKGIFESPLYVLDVPAQLGHLQWHGIVPPGVPEPKVTVEGAGDAGTAALSPACAGGVIDDFRRAPGGNEPVRSFKYKVDFDCSAVVGGLWEPPVFESIWILLRRRGASPAWTAWQMR